MQREIVSGHVHPEGLWIPLDGCADQGLRPVRVAQLEKQVTEGGCIEVPWVAGQESGQPDRGFIESTGNEIMRYPDQRVAPGIARVDLECSLVRGQGLVELTRELESLAEPGDRLDRQRIQRDRLPAQCERLVVSSQIPSQQVAVQVVGVYRVRVQHEGALEIGLGALEVVPPPFDLPERDVGLRQAVIQFQGLVRGGLGLEEQRAGRSRFAVLKYVALRHTDIGQRELGSSSRARWKYAIASFTLWTVPLASRCRPSRY